MRDPQEVLAEILARCRPEGSCLLWTGGTSGSGRGGGYGRVSYLGQTVAVHILVFRLKKGRWPRRGKELDHRCKNRLCVEHLEEVTRSVNERRKRRRVKIN